MDDVVATFMASPAYAQAVSLFDAEHERIVDDIITLTEIPAPPFGEAPKAAAYLEMLRAHGLEDVELDGIGNAMGLRRGAGNGGLIVVAAHLDTVFPAGTNVKVRREGTKLFAPGVGDDTRSLAVLLAYMRALDAAGIRTRHDILFVGDVGEEGLGDLRGIRHLFNEGKYKDRIEAFFSIDGPDMQFFVTGAVGSKRAQLRRFRHRLPPERHGAGDGGTGTGPGAGTAQNHLFRQRHRRWHLGQRHPERGLDGG